MSFPIKDLDHHEQALREMGEQPDPEQVRYHLTAICALKMGEAHDINGPAHEFIRSGDSVVVRQCEDELRRIKDRYGRVYFSPTELV